MDCNDVLEQLAEYLDDDARQELCRAIEAHLSICRDCRIEVDSVRKTILLYHMDRDLGTPVRVSAGLESVLAQEYNRKVVEKI